MNQPSLVFHADWSSSASKRWCAKSVLGRDGRYTATTPEPVSNPALLLENLRAAAGKSGIVLAGFDFPIGVPEHYATRAGIGGFRDLLDQLSAGEWQEFFRVCNEPCEVSQFRPFYPNRSQKGYSQQHLLDGHKAPSMKSLLRRCEIGGDGQRQACSLFWTLGANAVGKAAIAGWREMLTPALTTESVRLWPFDGDLDSLFQPGDTVIAEMYPVECYGWLPGESLRSKTDAASRKSFGKNLLSWAQKAGIEVEPGLKDAIGDGFTDGTDDAFDAVVGLFGMLQVCLGQRTSGVPENEAVCNVEGWILGRQSNSIEKPRTSYSAATDPDLRDWLRWASESGEAPSFSRAIAEAASIADLESYCLLRPILLKLKQRHPAEEHVEK